jgi:hypothetical protein
VTAPPLGLEPVARPIVTLGEPIRVGDVDGGFLRVIPITGGTLKGPELQIEDGEIIACTKVPLYEPTCVG